jgi:hypothetical protein
MSQRLASVLDYDPGSFRDRTGRVFISDGSVYRGLNEAAFAHWQALSQSRLFERFTTEGKLVRTREVDADELTDLRDGHGWHGVLQHERIPFVSYAYEWCFGMLKQAAILQLELLAAALAENFTLKDASPYNIQWRGTQPVFIDIPSFVKLQPGDCWAGYRQFCQLFLYPLLLAAYKGIPFHPWLRGSIEGIQPHECRQLMSWRDCLRPGVMTHVVLHNALATRYGNTQRNVGGELRQAGFRRELIEANVRGLLKLIRKLHWRPPQSEWSEYETSNSYPSADLKQKDDFVRRVAATRRWKLAWDLGANTGRFSRIVAERADCVVAMDRDYLAIQRLYDRLQAEDNRKILPLVMDLADPSVNRGWRGLERKAITNRGRPELTLCLALIHHLVISANIPLPDFVNWLAGLGSEVVIEFPTREDPMVERLLRFRDEQFAEYDLPIFERSLAEHFTILQQETLGCRTRRLYHLRPLAPG